MTLIPRTGPFLRFEIKWKLVLPEFNGMEESVVSSLRLSFNSSLVPGKVKWIEIATCELEFHFGVFLWLQLNSVPFFRQWDNLIHCQFLSFTTEKHVMHLELLTWPQVVSQWPLMCGCVAMALNKPRTRGRRFVALVPRNVGKNGSRQVDGEGGGAALRE